MKFFRGFGAALALACLTVPAAAQTVTVPAQAAAPTPAAAPRDGTHDFDFEIGAWQTRLKRLLRPLSGSQEWADYQGTTVVRKVWNGAANLVELEVDGPAGHIGALSLRLYNPAARQWSLNFANRRVGEVSLPPTVGAFRNGRGEFYNFEEFNGRMVWVRFVISEVTPDSVHFEQAFSDDGGKTWELNWIADDTRLGPTAQIQPAPPDAPAKQAAAVRDGAHDFDFNIGTWRTQSSRLLKPLTGSTTWAEMAGVTVVKPIWGGRANLAEFKAMGPAGAVELLSLRLYNPSSGQWNLNVANPGVGTLGVPSVGGFSNGRGVFYDQETINGRAVLVRFAIWPTGADTAQSERAFSVDGGQTWEVNWLSRYTRLRE